jgi:hypothetical protein
MHVTWEVSVGALMLIATVLSMGGAAFVWMARLGRWIGTLQTLLEQVIKDSAAVKLELASHNREDQTTFRQIEGTLNQIVGQLHVLGQFHVPK